MFVISEIGLIDTNKKLFMLLVSFKYLKRPKKCDLPTPGCP